jgi:hypothetical protein
MPNGVILWGGKLAAGWVVGFGSLLADATFSPTSTFTIAGGVFIILGTAWFTIRTNAVKFWREERDAESARATRAEAEAKEQRELKHAALTELAAERMKTDITPVLAELAAQKSADAAIVIALEALTENISELTSHVVSIRTAS